jgi:hypothetical protein
MSIRRPGNAFDNARVALRFATIVQRRMGLTDDASVPGRVPSELMQDAYAEAITEVAPASRGFVRPEAGPTLKLPSGQRMKPAG